jgi:4-hydroxybenzoate polyprenyltransferase
MRRNLSKLSSLVELCRPEQYYKNLVVFLAIIFSGNLFHAGMMFRVVFAFIDLCILSSAIYILNDINDSRADRLAKDKSRRPLAAGKVGIFEASMLAAVLTIGSVLLALYLGMTFFVIVISIFSVAQIYNIFLKNELFLDIISISLNFVLRTMAGGFVIAVWVSPWLVMGAFFLALFLATGKRKSEKMLYEKSRYLHRPVLEKYSDSLLDSLMQINTTILILAYALYCFLGPHQLLLVTLPMVLYSILRYSYLVNCGSEIARNTAKIFADFRSLMSLAIYLLITFVILYFDKIIVLF